MKGDDIAERLLEFAVAVLRITTRLPAELLPRRPPAQLSRSELMAHSQFPVLCSPVGLDFRLTQRVGEGQGHAERLCAQPPT